MTDNRPSLPSMKPEGSWTVRTADHADNRLTDVLSLFKKKTVTAANIPLYSGIVAILWTILNISLLAVDIREDLAWVQRIALNEARAYFNKDQAFRFWAASHGGVYVPVDRDTQPNPFLSHLPDRDITLGSGRVLTLMNPAYMVRQMNERYSAPCGVAGHITSLKPLRPQNAPDRWERNALEAFERNGIKEVSDQVTIGGEPYLRIMRPMIAEKQCLKCHGSQGYREGSVRGGVSISVPLSPHFKSQKTLIRKNAAIHFLIWVLGLGGIALWSMQIRKDMYRRTRAKELLSKSEESYRSIFENSIEGFYQTTAEGRFITANPALARMFGYNSPDEMMARTSDIGRQIYVNIEDRERLKRMLQEKGRADDFEAEVCRKDGSRFWITMNSRAVRDEDGKTWYIEGSAVDITGRKLAELALKESEERYRNLYTSTPVMLHSIDSYGRLVSVSDHWLRVMGYTRDEVIGRPSTEFLTEESRAFAREIVLPEFYRSGSCTDVPYRFVTKSGKVIDVNLSAVAERDGEGKLVRSLAVIVDVTERKKAEEKLRQSEERFRTIIEVTGAGYFRIGTDGVFQFVNAAWLQMHGYSSRDEVIGKHYAITQPDMDMTRAQELVNGFIHGNQPLAGESSRKNRDGSIGYQTYTVNPVVQAGKTTGLEGFLIDITRQKETMDALKKSEERFRALFNAMTEGVAIHRLASNYKGKAVDYIIMDCNPAFKSHTGMDRETVIGRKATEAYGTPTPPFFDIYEKVATTGEPARFDSYFEPLKKYFSISAFSPAPGFFATVFVDITERMQAEDSLKAAKEYAENLIQTANAMIIGLDVDGNVTIFNQAAEKITGYSREDMIGRSWFEALVTKERYPHVWEEFEKTLASETQKNFENPIITKSGEERIIAWQNSVLSEKGRVTGTISFGIDITERKIAEEKISASLREKELLLKEIHHRVKNNMQIIMSLLRMKAEKVRDPDIARLFQDSQNRIFSMALIHERLYQTQDFAQIDFNEYTRSLIEELFCMYDITYERIRYRIDIQDIFMGIDQAIPFGLVINELVTNSIKYAFPADLTGGGMIIISMSAVNGSIETVISDNGIGILESVDYRNAQSSGLTLVHMIVEKQLQGTIRLSREKGTTFFISIPRDYRIAQDH